ncbi:MADS-box transcription factor [Quillaja saponaria]|uniref:MADS-box transcription factor n=1 Tax=Quillaja saponaria TaxID=32244 RepID=A0AAD7KR53_QUISA|nr:MADS-box transcription factor [Quillaja saponaria]
MGRGKIAIKPIENSTNRQVTYSKRRNGIFKKAHELTVLCDAKVSLIMFSNSGCAKLHEYISPNTTTKTIYDQYQKTLEVDLWKTHSERMQESLKKLKETNYKLRREIGQRIGEDLNGLSFQDLCVLEEHLSYTVAVVRERKLHVIKTQTETTKKKVRHLEEKNGNLLLELEAKCEIHYRVVDNGDYESALALANGTSNLYAFHIHHNYMNPHHHETEVKSHDLPLA